MSTGEPPARPPRPSAPVSRFSSAPDPRTNDMFYSLGEAERCKFSSEETQEFVAHLDKVLTELEQLCVGVEDEKGLVSLAFGFDGRLVQIELAPDIGHVMTNLQLEKYLNPLFAQGGDGVKQMRPTT